jgi:hypothetical protein
MTSYVIGSRDVHGKVEHNGKETGFSLALGSSLICITLDCALDLDHSVENAMPDTYYDG